MKVVFLKSDFKLIPKLFLMKKECLINYFKKKVKKVEKSEFP